MPKLYLGRFAEFKNGIGLEFDAKMWILGGTKANFRRYHASRSLSHFGHCWICYIASKDVPMGQVLSRTSLGLYKVHLRISMRSLGGLGVKWEGAEAGKMTPNEHKYRFFWWKNGCLQGNFGSLKVIEKEERDNKAERYFNTKLDLRLGKAHLKIWCRMLKNPHTNISIRHWRNLFKYPNKTSFDSNWCNRRHDFNKFFNFFQNFFSEWIPMVVNN